MALAIPNVFFTFGSPLLGFIALVPLYIAISNCTSFKGALFANAIQIMIVHLLSSFWLAFFRDFAVFTLGASAIGTACIGAFFGLVLFFPYSTVGNRFSSKISNPAFRIIYFASVWTLWEWAKSTGFLGYPWGTLSMSVFNAKFLMQIVDITGSYGLTFLLALFSAVIGEGICLLNEKSENESFNLIIYKNTALVCLSFLVLSFFYGFYQCAKKRVPTKFVNTVAIQQNLDPWAEANDTESIKSSLLLSEQEIKKAKNEGNKIDLVVWSEAVLRMPFPQATNYYKTVPKEESLISAINRLNVPFLIGAPYTINRQKHFYGNAAVLLDTDGVYKGAYCKTHLVPFAEIIPGLEFDWVANLMDTMVGFSSGWKAGEQYVTFEIPAHANLDYVEPVKNISLMNTKTEKTSVKISTPICFEDAFSDVFRALSKAGTELFVNLTDDSWSLTAAAEYQHFVIAALRSIEYRTTMIRSTNSGYTVIIDPTAKIIADIPLFETRALTYSIPVYQKESTIYERFGNWVVLACAIFVVAFIIFFKTKKSDC